VQPGAARCRTCAKEFELHDLILLCPCGSADVEVLAGRDLKILSMEVS
jgi:hydrogenase nickel incorporation protein HypA/HybF